MNSTTKLCFNKIQFNFNAYDLIAIDMDNTLVKYKLNNSLQLIHSLIEKYLIEKYNYPDEICQQFCPRFIQKGLVVDKIRGNILKLDSKYRIVSAKHGFKDLSKEVIETTYGHKYEELKRLPELLYTGNIYKTPGYDFHCIRDYFSTPWAQVLAKCVEVMDRKSGLNVDYLKIWTNIYEILVYIYGKNDLSAIWGQELTTNPDKYLMKSSDKVKDLLKSLRKSGKHVVLITSSNVDAMKFLMNYSFGDQWISCFDFAVTFSRKPTFFTTDRKFLAIDSNDVISGSVESEDLQLGAIYAEGNWDDLKRFAAKQLSRSEPKCVYIGDSFIDDCIVPNKYGNCDTVAVVEELEEDLRPELDSSYWKSFFGDSEDKPSLWYSLLRKHTKLIVPKIDCLVDYSTQ